MKKTLYTFRCVWCEREYRTPTMSSNYCSRPCAIAHSAVGWGMNKRQRAAMLSRPPGPKGCATVEEWLAAGGVIYRQETTPRATFGTTVRSRTNGLRVNGRVR